MVKISFVDDSGKTIVADAKDGVSVMEVALSNLVPGILADCGGACSCATCHVVVDPAWFEKTGGPSDIETELLSFVDGLAPTSRLSCQITVAPALDGLVLHLPVPV